MEKLQRRFGADIGVWFRTAVAEEGCTRGSLARGLWNGLFAAKELVVLSDGAALDPQQLRGGLPRTGSDLRP